MDVPYSQTILIYGVGSIIMAFSFPYYVQPVEDATRSLRKHFRNMSMEKHIPFLLQLEQGLGCSPRSEASCAIEEDGLDDPRQHQCRSCDPVPGWPSSSDEDPRYKATLQNSTLFDPIDRSSTAQSNGSRSGSVISFTPPRSPEPAGIVADTHLEPDEVMLEQPFENNPHSPKECIIESDMPDPQVNQQERATFVGRTNFSEVDTTQSRLPNYPFRRSSSSQAISEDVVPHTHIGAPQYTILKRAQSAPPSALNAETCDFCHRTLKYSDELERHEDLHVFELSKHQRYWCCFKDVCAFKSHRAQDVASHARRRHKKRPSVALFVDMGQYPDGMTRELCLKKYLELNTISDVKNLRDTSAPAKILHTTLDQFPAYYQQGDTRTDFPFAGDCHEIKSQKQASPLPRPPPPSDSDSSSGAGLGSSFCKVQKYPGKRSKQNPDIHISGASPALGTASIHRSPSTSSYESLVKVRRGRRGSITALKSADNGHNYQTNANAQFILLFGVLKILEAIISAKLNFSSEISGTRQRPENGPPKKTHTASSSASTQPSSQQSKKKQKASSEEGNHEQDDQTGGDDSRPPQTAPKRAKHFVEYVCIYYLAEPAAHQACARKGFNTLGGLQSHIESFHEPTVPCPECPPDAPKHRDNGRLKCHLQKKHQWSEEDFKTNPLPAKPDRGFARGMWQDWQRIFKQFLPNKPVPPIEDAFRGPNMMESARTVLNALDDDNEEITDSKYEELLSMVKANLTRFTPTWRAKIATHLKDGTYHSRQTSQHPQIAGPALWTEELVENSDSSNDLVHRASGNLFDEFATSSQPGPSSSESGGPVFEQNSEAGTEANSDGSIPPADHPMGLPDDRRLQTVRAPSTNPHNSGHMILVIPCDDDSEKLGGPIHLVMQDPAGCPLLQYWNGKYLDLMTLIEFGFRIKPLSTADFHLKYERKNGSRMLVHNGETLMIARRIANRENLNDILLELMLESSAVREVPSVPQCDNGIGSLNDDYGVLTYFSDMNF